MPMVTLNPVVVDFFNYLDPNIVYSNTNLGDHMCFCRCGLGFLNLKLTVFSTIMGFKVTIVYHMCFCSFG